jgi:hypothetical protein
MKKIIPFIILFAACQKSQTPNPGNDIITYENTPQSFTLTGAILKEASGIVDSRTIPGYLWVEEDGGNPPQIYLLKHDGTYTDSVMIIGATNRDWEDITIGPGPTDGKSYIYIADIGDNNASYADASIYRFAEPAAGVHAVSDYEKITFTYPDGAHDAEALLVDDQTKAIYIITKRETEGRIYKLAYPQSTSTIGVAEYVSSLTYTGVVSSSLGSDGKELIVKNYTDVYYYSRKNNEPLSATLARTPAKLGYQLEAQGEAIAFAADKSGFFTLSEEYMNIVPKLNFYKRKQ